MNANTLPKKNIAPNKLQRLTEFDELQEEPAGYITINGVEIPYYTAKNCHPVVTINGLHEALGYGKRQLRIYCQKLTKAECYKVPSTHKGGEPGIWLVTQFGIDKLLAIMPNRFPLKQRSDAVDTKYNK